MGAPLRVVWWRVKNVASRIERSMFDRARYSEPKMVGMGFLGLFGFPLYYLVWTDLYPQPYENLTLRLIGAGLFLPLLLVGSWPARLKAWLPLYWYGTMTYALPFFFTYMLLRNGGTTPWIGSHLTALLIQFILFDLVGFTLTWVVGGALAIIVFWLGGYTPAAGFAWLPYLPLLGFAVAGGIVCSVSQQIGQQSRVDALIAASNNIAHELRTPLASIRVAAQAVQRYLPTLLASHRMAAEAGLPVEHLRPPHLQGLEKSLGTMIHEVEHANTVIDMLLIASRPVGNIPSERISANACVTEALERYPFGSQLERQRVHGPGDSDFILFGSTTLLVHILFNLIKNALFQTGRAGKGEIEIRLLPGEQVNRMVVYDSGPGIAPDMLPRIFERFFSGSRYPEAGLGVGLAFVRAALQHMNGEISCRSRYGEYTEFTLSFPSPSGKQPGKGTS